MAVLQMLCHLLVERKPVQWLMALNEGLMWGMLVCAPVFMCTRSAILNTSLNYI